MPAVKSIILPAVQITKGCTLLAGAMITFELLRNFRPPPGTVVYMSNIYIWQIPLGLVEIIVGLYALSRTRNAWRATLIVTVLPLIGILVVSLASRISQLIWAAQLYVLFMLPYLTFLFSPFSPMLFLMLLFELMVLFDRPVKDTYGMLN